MPIRWGPGPVFEFESGIAARRWQGYAGRASFVGLVLASLVVVWLGRWWSEMALDTIAGQAELGVALYNAIVGTELTLVLLAAPAATAGAICLDKARGTLTHVLVTDLTAAEIVLGKLLARVVPVLTLVLATLPAVALATLLGGIDPVALSGAFAVILGSAVLGCSLALLLSVWGRKTHEVLMAAYGLLLLWTVGQPISWVLRGGTTVRRSLPEWFTATNPFVYVFGNVWWPGSVTLADDLVFLAGTLVVSALLAALAVARLRPAAARQADARPIRRSSRLGRVLRANLSWPLPGPKLDPNPVLWREWCRRRPSGWGRLLRDLFALMAIAATLAILSIAFGGGGMSRVLGAFLHGGLLALGFLFLSLSAATSLAEERVRGSLDVLLATPLSTRAIVWGKWWGAYRGVIGLAALSGLITLAYAVTNPGKPGGPWLLGVPLMILDVLAFGAALTSLGLAFATWVPRLGRAVGWTVAIDAFATVGWLSLVMMLIPTGADRPAIGLGMASPFFAGIFPLAEMTPSPSPLTRANCTFWLLLWSQTYAVIAIVLYIAILSTFDGALGRISDRFVSGPLPRPRESGVPPLPSRGGVAASGRANIIVAAPASARAEGR